MASHDEMDITMIPYILGSDKEHLEYMNIKVQIECWDHFKVPQMVASVKHVLWNPIQLCFFMVKL